MMKRAATVFLRAVIVLIGIGALAFLLWEPHIEGRNADATLFAIYFKDPFLAFAYVGSTPFFIGLFQAFRVLGYAGRNQEFTPAVVRSVKIIKHCAIALVAFVALGEIFILLGESDDHAGGVAIGIVVMFTSIVVAAAAAILQAALQSAADMNSRNDLTNLRSSAEFGQ